MNTQITNTIWLSATKLNLFMECKKCFWRLMNGKINRPGGIFPGILTAMDGVLKHYYDNHRAERTLPVELIDQGYKLFDDQFSLDKWRSFNDGGIRYNDKEENFIFMGMVDDLLIDTTTGLIIPFDFKTAKAAPPEIHKSFKVQLACYGYLLSKLGYEVTDFGIISFHWPVSTEHSKNIEFGNKIVKVDNLRIDSVERCISAALDVARAPIAPAADVDCQFCEYRNGGKLE